MKDKNIDQQSPQEIKVFQFSRLQEQLAYCHEQSPFYRKRFSDLGLTPWDIGNYEEFSRFPLTNKEALQKENNTFLSVPPQEVIDYVTTSGTLGRPVDFSLNETDLRRLALNERRSFEMVGVTSRDVVQLTTTLDRRFMAGMAYFLGLRELGAGVVRTGSGLPGLQWDSIARFGPTFLVAVPSFLLKMLEYALANGIDFRASSVKAAICIGEPLRNRDHSLNALGKRINGLWPIELFSTYASTEMATAFTECPAHTGNHCPSELIFPEILDQQGNPVAEGAIGELVVTPLGTRTIPLVRYATGDLVVNYGWGCRCGRNSLRISAPVGRKQQMVKFKGTSLYPQQIIETLNGFQALEDFLIEARRDSMGMDQVIIRIPPGLSAEKLAEFKAHLQSGLKVTPELLITPMAEIQTMKFPNKSRKPVVFLDYREH